MTSAKSVSSWPCPFSPSPSPQQHYTGLWPSLARLVFQTFQFPSTSPLEGAAVSLSPLFLFWIILNWLRLTYCKEIQPIHPKGNQSWIFLGRTDAEAETLNTLATWCKEPAHWKRPWCWERLKAGGEEDDRGWDGWVASPTQWTWVWVNSGSWWWTGRPGVLQSVGSQRVGHYWATEMNWTDFPY